MPAMLTGAQLARDLAITDLSDPAEGRRTPSSSSPSWPSSALTSAWGCAARWCRGPRIVTIADNYDHLGYLAAAVTREASYTRYVDDTARAAQPQHRDGAVRAAPAGRRPADDVLLVCPGIVYRRDAIDWQHSSAPHQLDLWRISRKPLGEAAMHEMITVLLGALAPGRESMQQRRDHPYTTRGAAGRRGARRRLGGGLGVRPGRSPGPRRSGPGPPQRPGARHGPGPAADAAQGNPGHPAAPVGRPAGGQPDAGPGAVPAGVGDARGPQGPVRGRGPGNRRRDPR